MDQYEELLASLGEATGIDGLMPDDDGVVMLEFDDKVTVLLQPDPERRYITLVSVIGRLDEVVPGDLLLELLCAHLFGRHTKGATIAVERSMGQIVIQRDERLAGLTQGEFSKVLDDFVSAAEQWGARLSPDSKEELAAPEKPYTPGSDSMLRV